MEKIYSIFNAILRIRYVEIAFSLWSSNVYIITDTYRYNFRGCGFEREKKVSCNMLKIF